MSSPSVRRSSRLAATKRNPCIDAAPLTQAEIGAFVRPLQAAVDHYNTLKDVGSRYLQLLEFCPLIMQFPDQSAHYPAWRTAVLDMYSRNRRSLYCTAAMQRGLLRAWRQLHQWFRSLEELPTWRP
jgi:hypothetical protein